jgi:chemotaxis response regulator CheB
MASIGQSRFPVVALCSSRGGLEVVSEILCALLGDFPTAIIVAQHRSPDGRSRLAEVLDRRTELAVHRANAVVLTGNGHDGALGAQAVHAFGGHLLVQDEASAAAFGMPPVPSADCRCQTVMVSVWWPVPVGTVTSVPRLVCRTM